MPTLRIKYRTFDGFERTLKTQAAHFSSLHPGVKFDFSHAGPEDLYREMVVQEGVKTGDFDLMLLQSDWLPELMAKSGLICLEEFLASAPPEDWPSAWSESLLGLQRDSYGKVYALPYHDGPAVMHYRTDLFGNLAEQALFKRQFGRELRVPETWSDLVEVAKFFTRPPERLYGVIIAGENDGHNTVYDFYLQLWSRGGTLLGPGGQPQFDSGIGQEALQFYVDLVTRMNVTAPQTLGYDSVKAGEAYARGEGAMMLNWMGFMAVAESPPSAVIGKTRVTGLPRGDGPQGKKTSLVTYWLLAICSGSKQPDLAWAFLQETASSEMDRVTATQGGVGVRTSTWNDPALRTRYQYYQVMEEIHAIAQFLPAIPTYPLLNDIINRMSWDAVQQQKTVAGALRDAAEEWRQVLKTD